VEFLLLLDLGMVNLVLHAVIHPEDLRAPGNIEMVLDPNLGIVQETEIVGVEAELAGEDGEKRSSSCVHCIISSCGMFGIAYIWINYWDSMERRNSMFLFCVSVFSCLDV
jgi:hypothetical protein